MPRKNRVHYRNAFYHIMLRGNNRQNIFHNENDNQDFLKCLRNVTDVHGAQIHLYCLMTNHIHLVMEVMDVPLSKIMQSVSTKYAKSYNTRHKKIGHVFQGRFKSKLIQDDQYLLELCYYIHMNPVKAGICQSLDDYPWSSHHAYVKNIENVSATFINTKQINSLLLNNGMTYQLFINYYKANNLKAHYCAFDVDGDLIIKDSLILKMKNKPSLALENIPLNKIMRIICNYLDVSLIDLSSGSQARNLTLARSMIAYFSHYHAKYTLEEVAGYFCMLPRSVSKTLHSHLMKAKVDNKIRKTIEILEGRLSMSDIDNWIM